MNPALYSLDSKITDFVDNFDIDIVMNYFDGKNLFIKHFEKIKNRQATFYTKTEKLNNRNLVRLDKYLYRGFKIKVNIADTDLQTKKQIPIQIVARKII